MENIYTILIQCSEAGVSKLRATVPHPALYKIVSGMQIGSVMFPQTEDPDQLVSTSKGDPDLRGLLSHDPMIG